MKTCPRCQTELQELPLGHLNVDMCPKCEGSFWENQEDELGQVMRLEDNISRVEASELAPILLKDKTVGMDLEAPAKCPVCSNVMDRYQYFMVSDIWLDRCEEHGVWLDDGELRGIVDFYLQDRNVVLNPEADAQLMATLKEIADKNKPERGFTAWMGGLMARIFGFE
jgi:Zn-finger nucleic acid-binding protein